MRLIRLAVLVAMVVLACSAGESAFAQNKKKSKQHHGFHGVVIRAHHSEDKTHGHFTVREHKHNKTREVIEKTFKVNTSTTFERVDKAGKKVVNMGPTNFSHLHKGQHVVVHHNSEHATDVKIIHHKK
jgi:hypothetical protein